MTTLLAIILALMFVVVIPMAIIGTAHYFVAIFNLKNAKK